MNPSTGRFRLCYITDRKAVAPKPVFKLIQQALRAGVDLIQIREKDLATRPLLELVRRSLTEARAAGSGTRVVVNDRVDVALGTGAGGVHLGRQSLPPDVVRGMAPEGFLIGVSCHSLAEAREAEAARADYIVLGPVFETPSKLAYGPPLGLETLREVCAQVKIPVLALGGVTVERARECLEAGASGLAGISIFQTALSLEERVRELRELFSR
jgi:thiamine-phosphate pyrophosphorylase